VKATIKPYHSGVHKGHLIVLTDDAGGVLEKIAVTEVVLEGEPWPAIEAGASHTVRLVP
jgi:hypothetical protein